MFGWTFRWFHQKKRLSSDAGFVEYKGFWFAVKLITRVFSWPFDWFHGATYSLWLIPFLERTAESPWYSKCQPLIFPQGKLLSYSKTLFTIYVFGAPAQFSQIIFCWSAFFIQLYANKDSQSSCKLATQANSKFQRLSTHITREWLLSILERYRPRKQFFFEVRSSLFLHHPVTENCLFQCAVKQPIKLMSWTIFFWANILQKEFNLLQMEQVDLHCDFIPHLFVSIFLRFGAHSPVHLWQV